MISDLYESKVFLEENQSNVPFSKQIDCPFDLSRPLKDQISSLQATPFFWVDEVDSYASSLQRIHQEMQECPLLAVDLEYAHADPSMKIGEQPRTTIVGLIQISTHRSDYIFDVFLLRNLIRADHGKQSMRSLFGDANITKIMHGSNNDIKYMIADLGVSTVNLFDTARVFSYIQRISPLQTILETGKLQTPSHVNFVKLNKLI